MIVPILKWLVEGEDGPLVARLQPFPHKTARGSTGPVILTQLHRAVAARWPGHKLLDMLKETDLRLGLTDCSETITTREMLEPVVLQRRLLLCLYAYGTGAAARPSALRAKRRLGVIASSPGPYRLACARTVAGRQNRRSLVPPLGASSVGGARCRRALGRQTESVY